MRTSVKLVLALAFAVVLSGCVECELRVTNHTGDSMQFYTGHTKKTVPIPAGATRTIPHAAGQIVISTPRAGVWEYDAVDLPDFATETVKGFHRLTLLLTIESNGVVILPSGRKLEPSRRTSPGS